MSSPIKNPRIWVLHDRPLCLFEEVAGLQRSLLERIQKKEYNEDYIILTEFKPVITVGRRFHPEHLLDTQEELVLKGIAFVEVDRGGDVTCHGPGQLVVYPLADLNYYGKDLRRWVFLLEETLILTLDHWALKGVRHEGEPGIWVRDRKIVSIGVGCSKWVTYHGLALNVDMDLSLFDSIVPCGLKGIAMTSMQRELGGDVSADEVKPIFLDYFKELMYLSSLARERGEA